MNIRKTLVIGAAAFSIISITALAHPHKKKDHDTNNDVRVFKFDGDSPIKGKLKIEGFEFDLDEMGGNLSESLKELENLEGFKQLEKLSGLNLKTMKDKDGKMAIILKMDKKGLFPHKFGDMEFHFDSDDLDSKEGALKRFFEKHKDGEAKHKKRMKSKLHADTGEGHNEARKTIERLLAGSNKETLKLEKDSDKKRRIFEGRGDTLSAENGAEIYIFKNGKKPEGISFGDGPAIVFENDDVVIMEDGKALKEGHTDDTKMKVDKTVTIENGVKKTRIVIEMESPADEE